MDEIITSVLRKIGFVKPLKDCQRECLVNVLSKRDVMAILPTGYGKWPRSSAKYHLDCSVCLILTPLNSIMMDQINSLSKQGIRACWLDYNCESGQAPANEDSSDNEDTESQGQTIVNVSLDDIIQGKYTLIYAHPEALLSTDRGTFLLSAMERNGLISCIAIDEAHMILEW